MKLQEIYWYTDIPKSVWSTALQLGLLSLNFSSIYIVQTVFQ